MLLTYFFAGQKEGLGVEINDEGIFSGNFKNGFRNGPGRMDLANGTLVIGNFDLSPLPLPRDPTNGFPNPYLQGDPVGEVEVLFSPHLQSKKLTTMVWR